VSQLTVMIDPEKSSLLRAAPRLIQILRVLARHKFLGALRGKKHWPPPKAVREAFEELGLTFIKFGKVLALRRDLLPDAYIEELELLHDQLPAMGMDADRATVETELGAPVTELFSSIWAGCRLRPWRPLEVALAAISGGSAVQLRSRRSWSAARCC
jgi:ubiquinone biosynthesis protein